MSQIVDGYTGKPNIYADVIGEYNISMYGAGDYVFQVGECLGYELISNNEIHVKDGMFITQGRRGYIKKGTADICVIENGAQEVNRNDLIIIEYAKDQSTQVESHTTKVIKGTPGEVAADPDVITGDIPNGAILHQMPLYRVKLEGLNIVAVEQLFEFGSVAAETVDPMETTEPGFAADAYKTKLQFDEQNKKTIKSVGVVTDILETYKSLSLGTVAYGLSWGVASNTHPADIYACRHTYIFIITDNAEYNRIIVDCEHGTYIGTYRTATDSIYWLKRLVSIESFDETTATLNLLG